MTDSELKVILAKLEAERVKFTKADKSFMQKLIARLVEECVYPATTPAMVRNGYTHLTMVECWGSDWHLWRGTLNCPKCNSDWRDLSAGPPFKREIGQSQGDRTVAWTCPDCRHVVPRRFSDAR